MSRNTVKIRRLLDYVKDAIDGKTATLGGLFTCFVTERGNTLYITLNGQKYELVASVVNSKANKGFG